MLVYQRVSSFLSPESISKSGLPITNNPINWQNNEHKKQEKQSPENPMGFRSIFHCCLATGTSSPMFIGYISYKLLQPYKAIYIYISYIHDISYNYRFIDI